MKEDILKRAKEVLQSESDAINHVRDRIENSFAVAVEIIKECKGKVIVTGMGKSGIIADKISSTLSSTGTPSFYLNPSEGAHGDFGMISRGDVAVALSYSGETDELNAMIPIIKRFGIKMIALTGNTDSNLAKMSDAVIDVAVKAEACSLGLVPTCSTTAMLAIGDALAVVLLEEKGFRKEDYAILHPGGNIGRQLIAVSDLMHKGERIPKVDEDTPLKEAIFEITSKRLGITAVVDGNDRITGIFTDGDLRRAVEKLGDNIMTIKIKEIMTKNPKTIEPDRLCVEAVEKMEKYSITSLLVSDSAGRLLGVIHLHDILKAGVV